MNIHVASGTGIGPTKLAAFDAALNSACIANYNLLTLSSVIPPASRITVHRNGLRGVDLPGQWGDRLYVVMAEIRADAPGAEAWAGIGWVQDEKTGKGLFVEHEGSDEHSVRSDIEQSLKALMATRNVDFGSIHMEVVGKDCVDSPVCAMVIAAYQASDWDNQPLHFSEKELSL